MRYARPRLEHQTRDAADRNMRAYTGLVDDNERSVKDIQMSFLDVQNR